MRRFGLTADQSWVPVYDAYDYVASHTAWTFNSSTDTVREYGSKYMMIKAILSTLMYAFRICVILIIAAVIPNSRFRKLEAKRGVCHLVVGYNVTTKLFRCHRFCCSRYPAK